MSYPAKDKRRRAGAALLAACILVLAATASCCSADYVEITAAKDNTLIETYDADAELNSGGASEAVYVGMRKDFIRLRAVLDFEVTSSIPVGSTVHSAKLRIFNEKSRWPFNYIHEVHALTKSFGEGISSFNGGKGVAASNFDATWLHAEYPNVLWDNPGGDFGATALSTIVINFAQKFYTFDGLADTVQEWVNVPDSEHGFIILGDETTCVQGTPCEGTARKILSSEFTGNSSFAPTLIVQYTPPATAYAACCLPSGACRLESSAACTASGGVFNPGMTSCESVTCSSDCTAQEILEGSCITGACCVDDYCAEVTASRCAILNGEYKGDDSECDASACALVLEPFVDQLPDPGVAIPYEGRPGGAAKYQFTVDQVRQKLHRDLPPTVLWGYNNQFPGPTIEAWSDEPIEVTWLNNLRDGWGNLRTSHYLDVEQCIHGPTFTKSVPFVIPHVHGGKIHARSDGHPDFQFPPGQQDTYTFHNKQTAGFMWYHDHAIGITRLNVYMGLAGCYFIRDEHETNLELPSGKFEIPIVIMDRQVGRSGKLIYPSTWTGSYTGDFFVVNGKIWPYVPVMRASYRLRFLNGCNSRVLELLTDNNIDFTIISSERALRKNPLNRDRVTLVSGERVDVIVHFQDFEIGDKITLKNVFPRSHNPLEPPIDENVLQFHIIEGDVRPRYEVPATLLETSEQFTASEQQIKREFILSETSDTCGGKKFQINGLMWDEIVEYPVVGTSEQWTFVNYDSVHIHPMHMHLAEFTVLQRQTIELDGQGGFTLTGNPAPPYDYELGIKDMVGVGPLEAVTVVVEFPTNHGGRFPYHCHVLEHEDHDMMRQFFLVQDGCNNNNVCEDGEDCHSCPSDCASGVGSRCGNGLCEIGDGENCASCPEDCPGVAGGICCGSNATGCNDSICVAEGKYCRVMPQPESCCGDTTCTGEETPTSCPVDCPTAQTLTWAPVA